jgi:hypothetical protein
MAAYSCAATNPAAHLRRSICTHAVQTIRGHKDRTEISSGNQSAFMLALWLHQPEAQ